MKIRMRTFFVSVCVVLSLSSAAGQSIEYEKVLIPIYFSEPIETGGRVFETRLTVLNFAAVPVSIHSYDYGCRFTCGDTPPTPPGVTFSPKLGPSGGARGVGLHVYVEKQYVDSVAFDLALQELSGNHNWETKIPVVRERDLRTFKVNLIGISIADSLRQTIRIYDFDRQENARVMVRIFGIHPRRVPFDAPTDPLLFEGEFAFDTGAGSGTAGYIQLGNLGRLGDVHGTVRVEIESRTPGLRFWAFASINDSITNEISIISP